MYDKYIMHKLILLFVLLNIGRAALAQGIDGAAGSIDMKTLNDIYYDKKFFSVRTSLPEDITFDFQKHLFDDERPTVLYTLDGDTVTGNFKYNILEEILESERDGKFYPYNTVVAFKFPKYNDQEEVSFINLKLFDKEGPFGGFVQNVSTSPDVKIRYYLVFKKGKESTLPYAKTTSDDRVEIKSEILMNLDGKITPMPERKNDFFDLFPNSEELKKYAKKNKLKTTEPEDIGKMVTWVKSGK